MMWDWHGWGSWSWVFMTLWMVAFWGAVLWVILAVLRNSRDSRADATRLLAGRFARGDVDAAEYERRLDVLRRDARDRVP